MVRSIDPRRVTLRQFHWPLKAVPVFGTRVAEAILASGHVRPHTKAVHMDASDPIKNICRKHLQVGAVHIWNWGGTLDRIHEELYVKCREAMGREASPTAAIIDSQSVKGTEKGGVA